MTRKGGACVLVGLPPGEFPVPLFDVVAKRHHHSPFVCRNAEGYVTPAPLYNGNKPTLDILYFTLLLHRLESRPHWQDGVNSTGKAPSVAKDGIAMVEL
jgi:hypothetical protein